MEEAVEGGEAVVVANAEMRQEAGKALVVARRKATFSVSAVEITGTMLIGARCRSRRERRHLGRRQRVLGNLKRSCSPSQRR
jgi:hypothetical protein